MNVFSCWYVNPGFLLLVQYFRKSLLLKPMGMEGCSLESREGFLYLLLRWMLWVFLNLAF